MSKRPVPPTANSIKAFMHCRHCLAEKPRSISPRDWSKIEVGWTEIGLQVWCRRHECNVLHVDFEGRTHPANVTSPNREVH